MPKLRIGRRLLITVAGVSVPLFLAVQGGWAGDPLARLSAEERALVAAVRATAAAQCDCAGAASHRSYLHCMAQAITADGRASGLSKGQMQDAMKCAARSTCGRRGSTVCCKTDRHDRTRCAVTAASRCTARKDVSACTSGLASVCDALAEGCPAQVAKFACCHPPVGGGSPTGALICDDTTASECAGIDGVFLGTITCESSASDPCAAVATTTTTVTVTTTTIGGLCGNGVLDPGEECDPPWSRTCPARGPGHVNRECQDNCTCPVVTTSTVVGSTTSSSVPTTTTTTATVNTTTSSTTTTSTSVPPTTSTIAACTPIAGTARTFTVSFTPPGVDVAGVTVLVDYPEGQVTIPGSGNALSVKQSILNVPAGAFSSPDDLDFALRESIASSSVLTPGAIFTIKFEDCQGATPPTPQDFTCSVVDASDAFGNSVAGVTCAVSAP